jgi:hypothetical protein
VKNLEKYTMPVSSTSSGTSIPCAAPACDDDHVGRQGRAVVELHAGHSGDRSCRVDLHVVHRDAVAQGGVTGVQHEPAQHPLEGGAPTGERDEVLVAVASRVVHRRRQRPDEVHLRRAGVEERRQHFGVAVTQQVAQACEEGVGVPHLGSAAAIPGERLVGIGGQRCPVALDEDDLVAGRAGAQPDTQPADPSADHDDPCH